ncbi:MAG: Na/Pi cotransporter family protein [Rhodospirillales bacterium]|nr:Na/Pi cotransporter family protein [Rhodospirillales bacterium]
MLTLIDLAGAVALLLWGVHMVRSGVERAYGPALRRMLGRMLGNRLRAFAAGLGVTAVLQSSTATGLMVTSFAAGGLVDLTPGLAVMLGANVGTTLIVQVLAFNVTWLAGLGILAGFLMFRRGGGSRVHDLGRVLIGLGLMLTALDELEALVEPLGSTPALHAAFAALASQPGLAVLLGAVLAWAAHSSAAVVLLVISLSGNGILALPAAIAIVLGANLGSAVNPLIEGAGTDPAARRLPLGNLLNRVFGTLAVLVTLPLVAPPLARLGLSPGRLVADFHTGFNLVLALLFFPFLKPYAWFLQRLLPARVTAAAPDRPLYLDSALAESPPLALAAAAREALRMADVLETMLGDTAAAITRGDRKRLATVKSLDDVLDRLNAAIKDYLIGLDPDRLAETDHRRLAQLLTFATHLEQAGDLVEHNLAPLAAKRLKRGLAFSVEGEAEIARLLERLAANLRTAAAVLMTEDPRAARELANEKAVFRDLEASATTGHFQRLRERRIESMETSALHLDLVRHLKEVNAHLVAAAAYPVLEGQGELLTSRVRQDG